MMKLTGMLLAGIAFALAAPVAAKPLKFTISGNYNATFRLDSIPVPDFVQDDYLFAVVGVPGLPGTSAGLADLSFFNAGVIGGLLISDSGGFDYLFDANGVQLYTGPESAPTFRQGSFALTGLSTPGDFLVSISAVPEPASWGLLIAGFGLVGGTMRVRSRRVGWRLA